MKKLTFLSILSLGLLISCQKEDELGYINTPDMKDLVETKLPDTVNTNAKAFFNVIYSLDFSKNLPGKYTRSAWIQDWNYPAWANHANGYGKIVEKSGNKYLEENFPKGTFLLNEAGTQWLADLGNGYSELYMSYRVKFSKGFKNAKYHGKLPGLGGGKCNGGGSMPNGSDGFSTRYMFHGTTVNFYLYFPELYKANGDNYPVAGKKYYGCGPVLSPGFELETEKWYTLTQRIVLNTPGKHDGLVEGYINGKLCATQTGIRFRDIKDLKINKLFFATFFGGSGIAPTSDENICFDDFYVYTYNSSYNIARGHNANDEGTSIMIP